MTELFKLGFMGSLAKVPARLMGPAVGAARGGLVGAAFGGITSAVSGRDISEGALRGAAFGGLSGGFGGLIRGNRAANIVERSSRLKGPTTFRDINLLARNNPTIRNEISRQVKIPSLLATGGTIGGGIAGGITAKKKPQQIQQPMRVSPYYRMY